MEERKDKIVKYHNELNKLNMGSLKEKELELFYAICVKLRDRGTDEIILDITDFKNEFYISNKIDKKRFREYIKSVQSKFLNMQFVLETEKKIEMGVFFTTFTTDLETNQMIIRINKPYAYILNDLVEYYTKFSFLEYQSLKSKYSKIIMPRLSQWNSIRKKEFLKDELFNILGITEAYKNDLSSFNKRVLKPITDELKNVFHNLKIQPIKKRNKIYSYLFTWSDKTKKENIIEVVEEVKTLEISKKLKNLLDEAIKNPRLEILEKASTIEYLLKHYSEDIIIQGIRNLLNVTTKIKTRKYIVTVLDNIKSKENIKIKVKEETKTNNVIVEEFKEKEKIEITEAEYNKLLDEEIENYIQEAKKLNQNVNLEITKMSLRLKLNSKYKIKN
jgi:plasmid replication initiation protein